MNKMDFDSALRRQVMSLPELMRQQYADLEPRRAPSSPRRKSSISSALC